MLQFNNTDTAETIDGHAHSGAVSLKEKIDLLKTPDQSHSPGSIISWMENACRQIEEAENRIKAQQERINALEKLSSTDEMTGILNRRGFENEIEKEISRLKRGVSRGGLFLLIDLDQFKPINDTHGHLAGDACLRLVGRTLDRLTRSTDVVARLGGDEFAILLTDMHPEGRKRKAHEIQNAINALILNWQRQAIDIKCSMGVATYAEGSNFTTVYQKADETLYTDKNSKQYSARNR